MAQKLDRVMSAMYWCIVLLEDKHISSNAADQWQQFLHQQHFSVILPVDFIVRFNENEVGVTEFRYRNRDFTDLLSGVNDAQKTTGTDVALFGCH